MNQIDNFKIITDNLLRNINEQININIEQYYTQLNYLLKIKELEMKKKPSKIFKNRYNIWKKNINNINNKIDNLKLIIKEEENYMKK